MPLLPSDNYFQALDSTIGHGKPLGPLLHFLGLLPYIMNSKTQSNCHLQQKYREYPPASWPHAFSCANRCQNKYIKEGREDKCSSIIYIAESWIPTKECNPDFLKWVKISQTYINWIKMRDITNLHSKLCALNQSDIYITLCSKRFFWKRQKINFMDVISMLSLVYGNSPEYG